MRIGPYATREVAQQAIAVLRDALELPAVVTAEQPPSGVPFRIQVAAVREADLARSLVQQPSQAGNPAYLISPGATGVSGAGVTRGARIRVLE